MDGFYNEPSQEGLECYDSAMLMWTSWTNTNSDLKVLPLSEFIRQESKVDQKFQYYTTLKLKNVSNLLICGRGFGIDAEHSRLSAMHSFFQYLVEVLLLPEEFLKIAQDEKLEGCIELQAICINRWKLFTELLKRPQFLSTPSKPFDEEVTDEQKLQVNAFWNAFKRNLHTYSRKRKLTVIPEIEPSSKKYKPTVEEPSISFINAAQNVCIKEEVNYLQDKGDPVFNEMAIERTTLTVDSDSNSDEITINDDSSIAPPEEEITSSQVQAVEVEAENENIFNSGAFPEYDFSQVQKNIVKLKQNASNNYEKINNKILHHFNAKKQNQRTLMWKESARAYLEDVCQRIFPSTRLFIIGSTMNGCGSYKSDMDICAVIREEEMSRFYEGRERIIYALNRLKIIIYKLSVTEKVDLIRAVVPILKIKLQDGLEVDLNINCFGGIYNTHLIHHYSRQDKRFPAFCLFTKRFAYEVGINSAQEGTLNSYSWILMVIHFMQCACQPPILPNLQQVCPDIFNGQVPIEDLRFFEDVYHWRSENHSNFTELLMGFFAYYSEFDFDKYAISIKEGRVLERQLLPLDDREKYAIFIEEPFDQNNTARCVTFKGYEKIKKALKEGNEIWNHGKQIKDIEGSLLKKH